MIKFYHEIIYILFIIVDKKLKFLIIYYIMKPLFRNILLAIVIIVIVILVHRHFGSNQANLSNLHSAQEAVNISASQLPQNKGSNNFAYSIWFYVNDWQYRLTESKEVLVRGSDSTTDNYNPKITLAPYENNIHINITTYPVSGGSQENSDTSQAQNNNDCVIRNFPLQRWVNLIISLNGRTLDVYFDGKLVRTCVLPDVAKVISDADVNVTPNGGFSGWTSNLQFWSNPLNPQEAYNVYKAGFGGTGWGSFFDKHKIRVAYLVNNTEQGSFAI